MKSTFAAARMVRGENPRHASERMKHGGGFFNEKGEPR